MNWVKISEDHMKSVLNSDFKMALGIFDITQESYGNLKTLD